MPSLYNLDDIRSLGGRESATSAIGGPLDQLRPTGFIPNTNGFNTLVGSFDLQGILDANRDAQLAAALQQQQAAQTSADKAMMFDAEQAAINRQWQEDMSNSAYQRTVSDLRSAGLNPMLAVSNGASSFGSGSSASGVAASMSRADTDISSSISLITSGLQSASLIRTTLDNISGMLENTERTMDAQMRQLLVKLLGDALISERNNQYKSLNNIGNLLSFFG